MCLNKFSKINTKTNLHIIREGLIVLMFHLLIYFYLLSLLQFSFCSDSVIDTLTKALLNINLYVTYNFIDR